MKRPKNWANVAEEARCNINTYGAILALCENSLFLGGRFSGERRIARICKEQQAKELRIYDQAKREIQRDHS